MPDLGENAEKKRRSPLFIERHQLSGYMSQFDFTHPVHNKVAKKADGYAHGLAFSRQHTDFPFVCSIGKWNEAESLGFHIFKNEVYSHRDTLAGFYHFVTETKAACLKDDIGFKTGLTTFIYKLYMSF